MSVLFGAAPHGIQTVAALRDTGVLILLVPSGMVMREAMARAISILTPGERDEVRMVFGHPPVGMQAVADWRDLDRVFCVGSVPDGHRLDVADCACAPIVGPAAVV